MTDYTALPTLSDVYLEDSYVLDIVDQPGELKFRLEAVLTENHPAYQPPKPDEQYCYVTGWLIISNVTRVEWERRSTRRFADASGEEDFGKIDYLNREHDHWHIGVWGDVRACTTETHNSCSTRHRRRHPRGKARATEILADASSQCDMQPSRQAISGCGVLRCVGIGLSKPLRVTVTGRRPARTHGSVSRG